VTAIKHHLTHLTVDTDTVPFGRCTWTACFFPLYFLDIHRVLSIAARRATSVCRANCSAVELLVEFVDGMVKDTYHGSNQFIAPLAITIFCIVFMENSWTSCRGCAARRRQTFRRGALAHGRHGGLEHHGGNGAGGVFADPVVGVTHKDSAHSRRVVHAPFHAHGTCSKYCWRRSTLLSG